tara:strand:- start:1173 stop:1820 length:648 start_codon:yes stop_codon:yes gene_type:complete
MTNQPPSTQHEFNGIYGKYTITSKDKKDVKLYRFSLLFSSIGFSVGLIQWIFFDSSVAWIWLVVMAIGLGGSLKWIHIYLTFLHKFLQILWGIGVISIIIMIINFGPENIFHTLSNNRIYIIAIGPLFAALTGIGFKEFFCFRRAEAIGLTLFTPIALLGHISNLLNENIVIILLFLSALLSLIMSIRKFGMESSSDIGDKSVFEYLGREKVSTL